MSPDLDYEFAKAKEEALVFIKAHNRNLPSDNCPRCGDEGHLPGLPCPACGYRHSVSWAILRGTEWGYAAVAISNPKLVLGSFLVEDQK